MMRIDTGEEMGASICHPDTSQWKLLLSLVVKVDPLCTQKEPTCRCSLGDGKNIRAGGQKKTVRTLHLHYSTTTTCSHAARLMGRGVGRLELDFKQNVEEGMYSFFFDHVCGFIIHGKLNFFSNLDLFTSQGNHYVIRSKSLQWIFFSTHKEDWQHCIGLRRYISKSQLQ